MKITVERIEFSDKSTIGRLTAGDFTCFTLEDTDRRLEIDGCKIFGKTAIPRGTYKVLIDFSNRFKCELPRLLDVPQFEGVRIHAGNKPEDTEGCILVGASYTTDWLNASRHTFDKLFALMEQADERGEDIEIEVL